LGIFVGIVVDKDPDEDPDKDGDGVSIDERIRAEHLAD